jgi:hypothetical protein
MGGGGIKVVSPKKKIKNTNLTRKPNLDRLLAPQRSNAANENHLRIMQLMKVYRLLAPQKSNAANENHL